MALYQMILERRQLSLPTLRRLAFVLPLAFLIAVDYVRHALWPATLHTFPGFLALAGVVGVGIFAFSQFVFGTIERMQGEIARQNRELARLVGEARQRSDQLRALNEAGIALAAEHSYAAVLQKVVDLSRALAGARYGALGVLDDEGRIERFFTSGLDPAVRAKMGQPPQGHGVVGVVIETGAPLRLPDVGKHPRSVGFPPGHPPMRSFLGVPIVSKGRVIGSLYLTEKLGAAEFTQEDESGVVMLAAQAAVAIEKARLYEQVQALAVLEERERIAQDLHDGIIQSIYAIGLSLERCALVDDCDPAACRGRLDRAIHDLNGVIKDVRNYIMGLEPGEVQEHGLRDGLRELARELRASSPVQVDVVVEGEVESVVTEVQVGHLFQIAREALANVLKHAAATRASLALVKQGDELVLSIEDDGVGFDPARSAGPERRGLRNMAERARDLGGELCVTSAPGEGTTLTVRLPAAIPAASAGEV